MPPLQYVGARGQAIKKPRGTGSGAFAFTVNEHDIERITRKLESVKGKPMAKRVEKAMFTQGDVLAAKMHSAAPRGPTGNLRRSIKARRPRRRVFSAGGGSIGNILVGPEARRAPHRHLVIRGTGVRPVVSSRSSSMYRAFGGRVFRRDQISSTGRMTKNPFVDRAARGSQAKVLRAVQQEWLRTL